MLHCHCSIIDGRSWRRQLDEADSCRVEAVTAVAGVGQDDLLDAGDTDHHQS